MCTVSMIGEHYRDTLIRRWPQFITVEPNPGFQQYTAPPAVTRQEFDELKRQVEEMVSLLKRAKLYDEEHGEPECEIEEKMAALRTIARLVGVDLDTALKGEAHV